MAAFGQGGFSKRQRSSKQAPNNPPQAAPINMSAYSPGRAQPKADGGPQPGGLPAAPARAARRDYVARPSTQQPPQMASMTMAPLSYGSQAATPITDSQTNRQPAVPWHSRVYTPTLPTEEEKRRERLTRPITNYLPGNRGIDYRNSHGPRMSPQAYETLPQLEQEFPGVDEDTLIAIAVQREAQQRSAAADIARAELGLPTLYVAPQETQTERRNREMDAEARAENERSLAELEKRRRPDGLIPAAPAGAPSAWNPYQPQQPATQLSSPMSSAQFAPQEGAVNRAGAVVRPYAVGSDGGRWAGGLSPTAAMGGMQPFQASYGQPFGGVSSEPNFQQRDAFINSITGQLGQMQQQSWKNPNMGAPQFDFGKMWGQAGDMVKQGWKNPLSALMG